ncbi:hypothetical protein CR162_15330 [Pseudoroseomonas rhizosphaerae]|uniref:Uncharacterized protein n=1 Tax=Teichococcus rhizosphaerae TaxID=1335062 RepID=A0A2C7A926_9PROT|nr:hypothetical protein [Pseudoroseomonas rhizosphaerae]PHK94133.1 hypothetical protein CR162_15330 [Pseudoroseomonas rhizosphaerae]
MAELTAAEQARLERLERTRRNMRGRRLPAVMPSKLARAAAFSPRSNGLSEERTTRIVAVRPYAVIEVRGRELGTKHRDMLVALFRLRARRFEIVGPDGRPAGGVYRTETTWREILRASGVSVHVNNLLTALRICEELRETSLRVFTGSYDAYETAMKAGRLPAAGWSDGIIGSIEWDGPSLDARVRVAYGEWVRRAFEAKHLVSLNADVYFRLRSDFARAWWPHIDSQPNHSWVGLDTLGELAGRDFDALPSKQRARFREDLTHAFDDLIAAGGLESWRLEALGEGRKKTYRVHYKHALPKQGSLDLGSTSGGDALPLPERAEPDGAG